MAERDLVDLLEEEWRGLADLGRGLDAAAWDLPTDCPGWTVKDQFSHLSGLETIFAGRPQPEYEAPDLPHIRNDIGRINEAQVDRRRSWPVEDVLAELDDVMAERVAYLRGLTDEQWAGEVWTPLGPGDTGKLLRIRLFDWWGHEQDVRRAVGLPGHLDGPVAEIVRDQLVAGLGYVVGKKAGAPDGTTVVFDVTGPVGATATVEVVDGRGRVAPEAAAQPTVTLGMDFETFAVLGMGRLAPDDALAAGRVAVDGDRELGDRIVRSLNITI